MENQTMIFVVVVAVMTRGAVTMEEEEKEGFGFEKDEGLTQCHNLLGAEGRHQGAAAVVFCRF